MNLIDLLMNIAESLIFAILIANYIKLKKNNILLYLFSFTLGQTLIITILNHFMFYEAFFALIYNIWFFLLMYYFRNHTDGPSVFRIIIYIILINIITSICTEIGLVISVFLFHFSSIQELFSFPAYSFLIFCISRPLIITSLFVTNKQSSFYRTMEPKYPFLYMMLFFSIYFLTTYLEQYIFTADEKWFLFTGINLFLTLISLLSYHLYNLSSFDHFRFEDQLHLKEELKSIKENLYVYEENQSKLISLRHDMKNHLTIINGYMKSGQYNQCQDYIQNSIIQLNQYPILVSSGHPAIDMMISSKLSYANSKSIETQSLIELSELSSTIEYDIAFIVGTLLDNAIENIASKDPYISVKVTTHDDTIVIAVKNSTDRLDNEFISNKPEKMYHGIGLRNVRTLAETYLGSLSIQIVNHFCTAIVIMNNTQ